MLDYKFSIKKIIMICVKLILIMLFVYISPNLSIISYIVAGVVIAIIIDLVSFINKKFITKKFINKTKKIS